MLRRLKPFELRLARLTRIVRSWSEPVERHRGLLHARQVMNDLIREGLRRAGLNPDDAVTLRQLGEPPPPPPRLVFRPPDARELLLAEAERLAWRMRGHPPSLARASPMELFAYYCVGEGARDAPA
ncbi:MAG TPA: hypothetical protein VK432_01705 [Stellaceae bacterium]|nr:hypothetical protein [Stellaceae bacterium]